MRVVVVLLLLFAIQSFAKQSDQATGHKKSEPKKTQLKWDRDGLCKEFAADGNHIVCSLEKAKKLCPPILDYSKAEAAYVKYKMYPCSNVNLLNSKVGAACWGDDTKAVFQMDTDPTAKERVVREISDDGKVRVWYFESIEKGIHKSAAAQMCEKRGLRLPSGEDFQTAKIEGLPLALKGQMDKNTFWTSLDADVYQVDKQNPLGHLTDSEGLQKASVICIR